MPFNLGSRIITNIPLAEYLATVAGNFRTIELHADPRYLTPHFTYNQSQKQTLRIYQERYQFNFTMHAPFVGCRLGSVDPTLRELSYSKILNCMRLAAELQIKLITFHPTTLDPNLPDHIENHRYEEEAIGRLLNEARKLGVKLLIENMPADPDYHPGTADGSRFQELLWLFPEPEFGLTLDIGHALQANVAIDSLLMMDRVSHFHFHDNDRLLDRHFPITANLTWWGDLIKKISKQYPNTTAILEMTQLNDQILSLNNLNQYLKKPIRPKNNKIPKITI
ncbi:MAG TPA: sugar phosphate isomerase/epimerase family protein [Bacillota bacterium]|nr:sugar phosphate isomerase/epimerase family protein [Bacillota bacterium]HOL08797.1 sugar phosphate isomerase/epimerase family protein [Bacillota bacterium]HPO96887.1 sugar phosphate isomerase/epimerase family protein [Bacillota bacterium]